MSDELHITHPEAVRLLHKLIRRDKVFWWAIAALAALGCVHTVATQTGLSTATAFALGALALRFHHDSQGELSDRALAIHKGEIDP